MTQHHPTFRKWTTETAAALLLACSSAFVAAPADAGIVPSGSVRPRAAVSSDAYRTPPQLLTSTTARPLEVQHRGQTPLLRGQTPAHRPIRDRHVRQVDHQQLQHTDDGAGGYSVQAELQRLYAEEGRAMPQMSMPSHRHTSAARPGTAAPMNPPANARREERSSGLLAGLFDFARSRDSRRNSSMVTRPPVEPEPFRPPTYRQQQRMRQVTPTPGRRTANVPPAQQQQRAPQAVPPNSVIELKRVTPQRNEPVQGDAFFPDDDATDDATAAKPDVTAEHAPQPMPGENADELAEFFPSDAAASPAVSSEAETTKQQLQQMLRDQTPASESSADEFQMPVKADAAIVPQLAPAASSAAVTTTITPLPADGPAEPAPFFADEERAIDPDESMEISAIDGQTFDPSGADSQATAGSTSDSQDAGSRMQQIAARDGVGLKGYCPVALRDERRLADGKAAYASYYQGRAYYFSSERAKETFDASPSDYAPASGGEDVTMKTLTGEVVEGSLDHSVWYKGRLYLFHTAENLKTFMAAPGAMAITK